jgi:phospholipid/cholesterol/gamma-HCH transport system ATP-binding protein
MIKKKNEILIQVKDLITGFNETIIHNSISFSVNRGDFYTIIGGSGSGKTTLLRAIVGLLKPFSGEILLLGKNLYGTEDVEREKLLRSISVLFQEGALFSGLTVLDNVMFPLKEFTELSLSNMTEIAYFWLTVVGLPSNVAYKMPSELSGGMKKRVALARALILEPEIVFLDEPTSGLDPISARNFDKLIDTLHEELGATIFMISHDLASIKKLSTKILALGNGVILGEGSLEEILAKDIEWINDYFASS